MNFLKSLEETVLNEGREWTRQRLEIQAQAEADRRGAVCPESGCLLKYRRTQTLTLITCVGKITIHAQRGYSQALRRQVYPLREYWGLLPKQRISPQLESKLVYTASATGSYNKAAGVADCWGASISDDTVHAVVQRVGQRARAVLLPPDSARTPQEFSLVIMMDGWMVRRRGPDWAAGPRKKAAHRVEWKEVKSAVIYRLETRSQNASGRGRLVEKHVVATPPETSPLDFGATVHAEARRCGLAQAKKVYVVIDGAVWLWNLARDRFSKADLLLDFHHVSEYLWAIAHLLHGQGTPEARTWAEGLLHQLRHGKEPQVIRTLEELLLPEAALSENTRESVSGPLEYIRTHRDHLHYQRNARKGAPIGSGSVESLCSQLQNRFKRTGQFWSPDGLCHLLRLDVLVRNKELQYLWN